MLGIDISPPSERSVTGTVPSNCTFVKVNFEEDWSFAVDPETHFDYIHSRLILPGVHNWPLLLRRCFEHMRPGGFIEVFEGLFDLGFEDGRAGENEKKEEEEEKKGEEHASPAIRWFTLGQKYLSNVGVKWDLALDLPRLLHEAGFTVLDDKLFRMPLYARPAAAFDLEADEASILAYYVDDTNAMMGNMTERLFAPQMRAEEGRRLVGEAKRDLSENGERRRYHFNL